MGSQDSAHRSARQKQRNGSRHPCPNPCHRQPPETIGDLRYGVRNPKRFSWDRRRQDDSPTRPERVEEISRTTARMWRKSGRQIQSLRRRSPPRRARTGMTCRSPIRSQLIHLHGAALNGVYVMRESGGSACRICDLRRHPRGKFLLSRYSERGQIRPPRDVHDTGNKDTF